jgi:hypothetical protein
LTRASASGPTWTPSVPSTPHMRRTSIADTSVVSGGNLAMSICNRIRSTWSFSACVAIVSTSIPPHVCVGTRRLVQLFTLEFEQVAEDQGRSHLIKQLKSLNRPSKGRHELEDLFNFSHQSLSWRRKMTESLDKPTEEFEPPFKRATGTGRLVHFLHYNLSRRRKIMINQLKSLSQSAKGRRGLEDLFNFVH